MPRWSSARLTLPSAGKDPGHQFNSSYSSHSLYLISYHASFCLISESCVLYIVIMSSRAIPIVIGVGDIKNRSLKVADAIEPLQLMLQATQLALSDTGLSKSDIAKLQSGIDHIGVVNTWTWQYTDLPSSIAEALGIEPTYKFLSHHGGDSPAKLFDEATRRIALGEAKVALITGGEALASCESDVIPLQVGRIMKDVAGCQKRGK